MKKLIFTVALVIASYTMFAQDVKGDKKAEIKTEKEKVKTDKETVKKDVKAVKDAKKLGDKEAVKIAKKDYPNQSYFGKVKRTYKFGGVRG